MNGKNNVRYLYLRDFDSDRVITVARQVNEEHTEVKFSFCVNRPTKKDLSGNVISRGDNFNKALGRHIALGRLEAGKNFTIPLLADFSPIETIIRYLGFNAAKNSNIPQVVERIANDMYWSYLGNNLGEETENLEQH